MNPFYAQFAFKAIAPIILVASMVLAIFYYKTRYEAITGELDAYKHDIQIQVAKKQAENEILRNQAKAERAILIAEHSKQLADANLDRKRETEKLKGIINEISDSLAIYDSAIKLRNSTSSSGLPKMAENTEGASETERNRYGQLATVINACRITDSDYKTLYRLYDKQCTIFGCE